MPLPRTIPTVGTTVQITFPSGTNVLAEVTAVHDGAILDLKAVTGPDNQPVAIEGVAPSDAPADGFPGDVSQEGRWSWPEEATVGEGAVLENPPDDVNPVTGAHTVREVTAFQPGVTERTVAGVDVTEDGATLREHPPTFAPQAPEIVVPEELKPQEPMVIVDRPAFADRVVPVAAGSVPTVNQIVRYHYPNGEARDAAVARVVDAARGVLDLRPAINPQADIGYAHLITNVEPSDAAGTSSRGFVGQAGRWCWKRREA